MNKIKLLKKELINKLNDISDDSFERIYTEILKLLANEKIKK